VILTEKHIIKKSNQYFIEIDKLCFLSKNLYNKANYIIRQEFIKTSNEKKLGLVDHANYLNYYDINRLMIDSNDIDYIQLPRKISNQTLMQLDKNWKSFFASIKDYNKNKSKYKGKPELPNYKDKINGRFMLIYTLDAISKKELKNNIVKLSRTNIRVKTKINSKNIKQCRVIPKGNHYVIEVLYEVKEVELKPNNNRYASIDLGLNNLATIGSNVIKSIIINGKPLKSINQYYNKNLAHYKSDLNHYINKKGEKQQYGTSNRIKNLTNKRNNKVDDYLHKASRYIINHLVDNNINTLIIGNNKEWKQEINMGKESNQKFVGIPHSRFIWMLEYKAKLLGINVLIQEESYTSKASFIDEDEIPVYKKKDKKCENNNIGIEDNDINKHKFSGRRIYRGLYRSKSKKLINADLNGSLNILRKAIPNIEFDNGIEVIAVSPMVSIIKK